MKTIDCLLNTKATNEFSNLTREEFEELKIKAFNDSIGELDKEDGIVCDVCHNKGWIEFMKNGYSMVRECECMPKRKIVRKAKRSGLGEYLNMRSKDYCAEEDWQKEHKNTMIDFCTNHAEDNTWFIALGQSGSGKTMICSIIANHLLLNIKRNIIYVTWTDFISKLKRDMMSDNTKEVSVYLDEIKNVDVLFLDEILKKYNETDLKYLIEIINYRYQNNLKTLITSERTIIELANIDEATIGRAVEKAEKYVINVPKDISKNYRLKKVL